MAGWQLELGPWGRGRTGRVPAGRSFPAALFALGLALALWLSVGWEAQASSVSELQRQIQEDQQRLQSINQRISSLSDEQDLIEERIDDLNAEILNTMTSIGLKEEEILQLEAELVQKEAQIQEAMEAYARAKAKEEEQYLAMKARIRFMYENDGASLLTMFFGDGDFGQLLNRADYVESIYTYDQNMLQAYAQSKLESEALWRELEAAKAELEASQNRLEAERDALAAQKSDLDAMLAQKKRESANFDVEIARYRQEAAAAKQKLAAEQQALKRMQSQSRGSASAAAKGSYTVKGVDASVISSAAGSDLGKKIAQYACQYVGNPYVAGGTSLTNGADCSGFTYRVLGDFGYSLPRTSTQQRSAGQAVAYENAQPGDLVCYDGHVGIYIGGGYIVHASSARTGIKISQATYRNILAVRRVI